MKVVIVGAGAIGLLIGSYIGEKSHEITYVTRTTQQAHKLRTLGLTRFNPTGGKVNIRVDAVDEIGQAPTEALWIVAVKYHHLSNIERELQKLPLTTRLVFIQNGLAHLQWMENLKQEQLYIATIEHGAMKKDETTVHHKGVGLTRIAPFKQTSRIRLDISSIQSSSFEIDLMDNAYGIVLRKAILNACINPITAILHIKNGELISNQYANQLMKDLFNEIQEAFPEIRTMLSLDDVYALCGKTALNYSSMLQDLQYRRKTEIEPIVGAIIQLASTRNKELPLMKSLYHIVLAMEEKGDSIE